MTQPYYDQAAQQQPGPYPPAPPQQPYGQPQQNWQQPPPPQPGPPQQNWQQPYGQPQQAWQQPPPQQAWQQPPPGYGPPAGWQGQPGPQGPSPDQYKVGIADFYDDPATGEGASINGFFKRNGQPMYGQSLTFQIARGLTDADVRVQTRMRSNEVATFNDGRVKKVLVIPVTFQPNAQFPDGRGTWWVRGAARDELARAMETAGVPADEHGRRIPEAGATVTLTLMGSRPVPGFNDAMVWQVVYYRPQGAANGQPQQPPAQQAPNGQQFAPQGQALQQAAAPEMAQMAQQQGQQFAQAGAPVGPGAPQGYQPPNGQPQQFQATPSSQVQPQFTPQQQQVPQAQFQAPQPQQGPPAQQYGMQPPGGQVAAATQAAQAAGVQHMPQGQVPPAPPLQGPPGTPPDRMNLLANLAGPQAAQQFAQGQPQQ